MAAGITLVIGWFTVTMPRGQRRDAYDWMGYARNQESTPDGTQYSLGGQLQKCNLEKKRIKVRYDELEE